MTKTMSKCRALRDCLFLMASTIALSCNAAQQDLITLDDIVRQAATELATERNTSPNEWKFYGVIPECSVDPVKSVKLLMLMGKYSGASISRGGSLPCEIKGTLDNLYIMNRESPTESALYSKCFIEGFGGAPDASFSPSHHYISYGQIFPQSREVTWNCILSASPNKSRLVTTIEMMQVVGVRGD